MYDGALTHAREIGEEKVNFQVPPKQVFLLGSSSHGLLQRS